MFLIISIEITFFEFSIINCGISNNVRFSFVSINFLISVITKLTSLSLRTLGLLIGLCSKGVNICFSKHL